jgi:hypothetical protein
MTIRNESNIKRQKELLFRFIQWGGKYTPMTAKQKQAFKIEAEKIGLPEHIRRMKYITPKLKLERYKYIDRHTGKTIYIKNVGKDRRLYER